MLKWACIDQGTSPTLEGLVSHRDDDIVHIFQVDLGYWLCFATDVNSSGVSSNTLSEVLGTGIVCGDSITPVIKVAVTR